MSSLALLMRAGAPMSLCTRSLRRSVVCLLGMLSGLCAAQMAPNQFISQPKEWLTGGRVTSFLTGTLQSLTASGPDILFINAPTFSGSSSSILVGELLQTGSGLSQSLKPNQIVFPNVSNVAAALGDFNGDNITDYAFVLSPMAQGWVQGEPNTLCVYYGTGATINDIEIGSPPSSYNNALDPTTLQSVYPPATSGGYTSGCMAFHAQGSKPPNFQYVAALPFTTNGLPQLLVEDTVNNYLYIFTNSRQVGSNGVLNGFAPPPAPIYLANGAGPIYTGDFNHDGCTDFIINGQSSHTATVYLGNKISNCNGSFLAPVTVPFTVNSMLLQVMVNGTYSDGTPIQDMVVEGENGVIGIYPGKADGTFATTSAGGTAAASPNALSGIGGHLAAIDPNSLNILTTTPIGLSVLQPQSLSNLNYTLKNIYNIGPGRSSFALAHFLGNSTPELAVDSAEGVIFALGDTSPADGGFQTSLAYPALAPALGATVGPFRNAAHNPTGILDVVVATAAANAVQGQLLTGNGNGTFNTPTNPTSTTGGPSGGNGTLWSNILSGDFNGDEKLDLAYSLTGLPLPTGGTGLYVQYGNGDGTFQAPLPVSGASSGNTLYGESTVGTFNSGANAGIANIDANFDDTLLGQSSNTFNVGMNQPETNTAFNQVAAGYFKTGSSYQDLVFQQGTSLVPYVNWQDGKGKNFTPEPALTVPLSPADYAISAVLLTDIDGDGNGDILAIYHNLASVPSDPSASTPNWMYIWWGDGTGNFVQSPPIQLSRNYYMAAVGDISANGRNDIVLSDGYLVSILFNPGGGTPANRAFASDWITCVEAGGNGCIEQHFMAGQGINSLTLQSVHGGSSPDVVVANGGATISNPIVLGGAAQTSATLPVNPDVNTGGITVLLNGISTQPVSGTLTALPEPSNFGASFTITATLTPSAGVALPTGTVMNFEIDGTAVSGCSSVNVTQGTTSSTATCPVPAGNTYGGGPHTLTAIYSGDGHNSPVNLSGTHDITGVTTTTQIFFCVGPPAASCPAPPAVITPPAASSLSMYYGQYWNGTINTSSNDTVALTGNVNLNDNYTGAAPPPPSPLCTLPVTGGACPNSVGTTQGTSVGTNILTGVYLGDATHASSTSSPVTITVSPDTTSASVTGSPATSPQGQPVTFTATLTGNFAPPDGPVAFMYGSTTLCSLALVPNSSGVSSTATCTTSSLPAGTDQITASYAGDMNFLPAPPASFSETITPLIAPSFVVTVTPNPVSVGVGYAAILSVSVTPLNGFAQDVNLACGNLPAEATCIFTPSAIAGGAGSATLIVVTTAPHSCGTTQPYFLGGNRGGPGLAPLALPALAGLLAIFIPGKRRWLRALLAVLLAAGATHLIGCSTCTDLGTRPASYAFQVTAAAAAGSSEVESQAVTLNLTI